MVMPKSDTIAAIRRINPTAVPEFLSRFSNDDLLRYLGRLYEVAGSSCEPESPHVFGDESLGQAVRAMNRG